MTSIVRTVHWKCGDCPSGCTHTGNAEFVYDTADPFAVAFRPTADKPWQFSREILAAGLAGQTVAGTGDVRIWLTGFWLYIHLTITGRDQDEGEATFVLPAGQVRRFLAGTAKLVPLGEERIDYDAEMAHLLGGAQ